MFRALNIFPGGASSNSTNKVKLEAPLSVKLVGNAPKDPAPVELEIRPDAIFTTAVGHSSKRTLASWHVTAPQEVVDHMLEMIDFESGTVTPVNSQAEPKEESHL